MSFKVVAWFNKRTEINFLCNESKRELSFKTKAEAEKFIRLLKDTGYMQGKYHFTIEKDESKDFSEKQIATM
ncbi:hypothetical protein GCM10007216_35350 [Thalassobacillus devorans]|uniref:Uncharacterized protein n=1 Tax=Thalassobacillus devorans TaxID=279813 RepID=A0ABQ1PQY1_9BACI|nr:hypothetical protein [Thalassobacillus devorans]NIK30610.1 hypothetical protein [Thalassobacillus devorans]GGD01563.1 hypothetical protein GCM10007216_35350 [Thalassobacillus devorans]